MESTEGIFDRYLLAILDLSAKAALFGFSSPQAALFGFFNDAEHTYFMILNYPLLHRKFILTN